MQDWIEKWSKNNGIDNVFLLLKKIENLNLFYDKKQQVNYLLYTDGITSHIETWIDKCPGSRDMLLVGCNRLKRFELEVMDANIILIEKHYKEKTVKNIYVREPFLYKILEGTVYQIGINEKENIMVKKIEGFI